MVLRPLPTRRVGPAPAPRHDRAHRRPQPRLATVPLVALALVLATLLTACSGRDASTTTGTTGTTVPPPATTLPEVPLDQGKQIYSYTPEVGDCFDRRKVPGANGATKQQDIVLKLDCGLPHVNEVFAIVELPKPQPNPDPKASTFPSAEELRKFGKTECPKKYKDYVGREYELSKLEIGYILPVQETWPSNRKLACYIYDAANRRLQGSVKGSNS
jgi:hypothetical protein